MDLEFLEKLNKIIDENLDNENFSINELSAQMNLSRPTLHRKLKSNLNTTANQFLKHKRLEKAKSLLAEKKFTAAEVAHKVGFASPAYFNKCFHDQYGYTPGVFKNISIIKQEDPQRTIVPQHTTTKGNETTDSHKGTIKKRTYKKLILTAFILSFLILVFFTYRYYPEINGLAETKGKTKEITIAILPFQDLSNNSGSPHFVEGIMEDIHHHISKLDRIKIISSPSVMTYEKSVKTGFEIAKELKITHFLTGSVRQLHEEAIITIQLVDAIDEVQIWSEKYEIDLVDIFGVQNNIAKKIATHLKSTITPAEKKQLEQIYTSNLEARSLYLQGRYYYLRQTKNDFQKSIGFYKKAIEIDPNYSMAYAALAEVYYNIIWYNWFPREEGLALSREYANKALALDKNLGEVHNTLGSMACYIEWDWAKAEKHFKLALDKNPNYAKTHQWYAEFLAISGRWPEARREINKALELHPHSVIVHWISYHFYYHENKFEEALQEINKILELNNKEENNTFIFKIKMKQDRPLEAIEALLKNKDFKHMLDGASFNLFQHYNESGKEGILRCIIPLMEQQPSPAHYRIAIYYAWLNNKDAALSHLEKAFEKNNNALPRIKYDQDLIILREEPRFLKLLDNMNLGGY